MPIVLAAWLFMLHFVCRGMTREAAENRELAATWSI